MGVRVRPPWSVADFAIFRTDHHNKESDIHQRLFRICATTALLLVLVFGDGLLPYEAAAIGRVSEVAAIGTAFTYQGRLSDNGVTANGPYDFEFQLYDALSGGVQIGSTLSRGDVQVTNGLFTVTLDFGASAFNGGTRYLSIGVRPGASTGRIPRSLRVRPSCPRRMPCTPATPTNSTACTRPDSSAQAEALSTAMCLSTAT